MNGPTKRLQRSRTDRWVAGVVAGVARYIGMDPTLLRLLFLVFVLATGGSGLLIYPVLWAVMPLEGTQAPDPVRENLEEMRQESERMIERLRSWGQRVGLWRRW